MTTGNDIHKLLNTDRHAALYDVADVTGYDRGEEFATPEQLREYFTVENMVHMFGDDAAALPQDLLDVWAEEIAGEGDHCLFRRVGFVDAEAGEGWYAIVGHSTAFRDVPDGGPYAGRLRAERAMRRWRLDMGADALDAIKATNLEIAGPFATADDADCAFSGWRAADDGCWLLVDDGREYRPLDPHSYIDDVEM